MRVRESLTGNRKRLGRFDKQGLRHKQITEVVRKPGNKNRYPETAILSQPLKLGD